MKKSFVQAQRRQDGQRYKHDLGQHFLYDEALLEHLVARTGVTQTDDVLEIGPGAGTLTTQLARAARRVIAVEVDETVLPLLRLSTEKYPNVAIVQGDVRRVPLAEITRPFSEGFSVVANLPYNITTPILELFWDSHLPVRQLSVMVQKEVADKLLALPGDEAYGLTSVRCRYRCEPELVQVVPATAFTPPPKVDSAFVNLPFRREPIAEVADEALLWRMVKAGFGQRRKTLTNALKSVIELDGDALRAILQSMGLSPTVRGEALSVEEWIALANAVKAAL